MTHMQTPAALRRLPLASALVAFVLLWSACGDDTAGPLNGSDAEVATYLGGLPTWEQFSPPAPTGDEIMGDGEEYTETVDNTIYDCTTTPYSLTENPEKIVTLDPDANVLWLGALLQGKGYKDGIGSLAELPIRERAPLTISVDLLTDNNMRVVENPSLGTVNQAIGDIIAAAAGADNRAGSSVAFSQERMYSVNQASLAMGLSAGYMSVSVKASLGASRTAAERTITAYFVQKMFTASVELPNNPMDFFSDEFTEGELAEQRAAGRIGSDNLPVYVSSITYGRILMFSFTSRSSITDIRAALSASFSSLAGASIEARYLDILNEAQISVVTVGGEGRNATALIQNGQLRDYFNEESALTSARPISYTVRNLGDNSIARVSETTEYNIVECMARPQTGELQLDVTPNDADVTVRGPGGFQYTSQGDQILRELQPGGYTIRVEMLDDPDFSPEEQEVTVAAGEVTDVTVVISSQVTPGGEFEVSLVKIVPNRLGCTWETGGADLFWEFKVNGEIKAIRGEDSAIRRAEGQPAVFAANTSVLEICDGESLRITGWLSDADGALNGPDRIATYNSSYIYHNIPTGTHTIVEEVGSCKATLYFSVVRRGDAPCSAANANSFEVNRRRLPIVVETWPDEPQWKELKIRY